MVGATMQDPLELLVRRADVKALIGILAFFQALAEESSVAYADSQRLVPAAPGDGPAVSARGNLRRLRLDRAFRRAAERSGRAVVTADTRPGPWTFPVIRIGAFSLTLGIADRARHAGPHRLRSRGKYVRELAARNEPLNPQASLFPISADEVVEFIPDGALGAFIVTEPSARVPDSPLFIGLLIPSPGLGKNYFRCSIEYLVSALQSRIAKGRTPSRKAVERKPVTVKRKKGPTSPD